MKRKRTIAEQNAFTELQAKTQELITDYYYEFLESPPDEQQKDLEYFDKQIAELNDRANIKRFLEILRNALKAEALRAAISEATK